MSKSVLTGPYGEVRLTWTKDAQPDPAEIIRSCAAACAEIRPPSYIIRRPTEAEDSLTLYPYADAHVGLLVWKPESGHDWDLKIAEERINEAFDSMVSKSPPSKWAVFLGLGDLFHADSSSQETERSHNKLDVEGRYDKIYGVVCRMLVHAIDALLLKHENVTARILKGNHDTHSSVGAAHFLSAYYRHEPRVTVDLSPDLFWYMKFGSTMLCATHGHEARAPQLAGIAASRKAKCWGETIYRYGHLGHLHRSEKLVQEGGGMITEIHDAPIPRDAYAHGHGFQSVARFQSITYSSEYGECERHIQPVRLK